MTQDHIISLRRTETPGTPAPAPAPAPRRAPARMGRLSKFIIVGLVVFALGFGLGRMFPSRQAEPAQQIPAYVPAAGTKPAPHTETDVIKAVAQLIALPDETPSVATVSDLAPLVDQAFFARAELGDAVLMYPQARLAILYRPSLNRLIQVAPLTLSQ